VVFQCSLCQFPFRSAASRRNHEKSCRGTPPGICPYCLRSKARKNMARHRSRCSNVGRPSGLPNTSRQTEPSQEETAQAVPSPVRGTVHRTQCRICSNEFAAANIRRHEVACARRREQAPPPPRQRPQPTNPASRFKECQHCGKTITATNISRHEKSCNSQTTATTTTNQQPASLPQPTTANVASTGRVQCVYCNEFKAASYIRRHQRRCSGRNL